MKTKIDHKNIKLVTNYVLVLPDKDYDKYHNEKGEETNLYAPTSFMAATNPLSEDDFSERDIMDTYSHNFSYSGTIIAIPEKLVFLGNEIKEYLERNQHTLGDQDNQKDQRAMKAAMTIMAKVEKMQEDSVDRLCDIDVKIGDKVYYDYLERFKVYEEGRVIQTDIGELFLIKYDKLELRIRDEEIKPLNGYVFVEWERKNELKHGSLVLEGLDKRVEDTNGIQECKVVYLPDPIKSHLDEIQFRDPVNEISVGDKIVFVSQHASNIENDNHFTLFGGREMLKVQSKYIIGICPS